ncbi:MAG: Alpha/Beta hydrolase protein [Benjaminiella poitrasii]|nr:MAG: Alpha/Beta hydrolase protein [Benjaminiella poitrasii]
MVSESFHPAAEIVNKHIKQTIIFWLPLRIRCKIIERLMSMPVHKGRKLMSAATKPWGVQKDYITKIEKKTWSGHWIVPNSDLAKNRRAWVEESAKEADLIIYYIHGGGFRVGDSLMYMESFIHIIQYLKKTRDMNARIFSIEYNRMPEVNYRHTREDCLNGYRYLIEELKLNPKKIVFAGDSAGGNLVASSLMTIRDSNILPQPAGNVQISPWINIENSQSSRAGYNYVDCLTFKMLSHDHGNYFHELAANSSAEEKRLALRNPEVSPLYGSFVGFCPTLVTYGGTEIFQHDIEELIHRLQRDNVQVDVITRHNAPHIWLISSILSPTHQLWEIDCSRLADWCADRV